MDIPAWLREAVIYQIFVDRFAPIPGQPFADTQDLGAFFGGALRGITARLDYLSELGVNCLWLTPIFPAPSHHGYDPMDYFAIEPRLGDMADFQELVAAAHGRGLRVVLDFVANHLSRQHPAFVAAQADPASPTRAWFFFRDYPQTYEAFYDVPDQPVVNTDLPAVREYLIGAAQYWLGDDTRRLKLAALCQFTLPQPPILYYGTEVGLSQRQAVGRLEEARLPMLWNEQQDRSLLDFYRRLIQLRRRTTDVWSEPRTMVRVDDEHGLYAYRCGAYLVVLNNHDQATALSCPAAELILTTDAGATLTGEQLDLPPFAGAI